MLGLSMNLGMTNGSCPSGPAAGPTVSSAPTVDSGTATVNVLLAATGGTYAASGGGTVSVVREWLSAGVQSATGLTDTPALADAGNTFVYRETAIETGGSNPGSIVRQVSLGNVVHVAPVVAGGLSDLNLTVDVAMSAVDVSADFAGQDITIALTSGTLPVGLSFDGTNLSGTPTAVASATLTFTGTNSGGSDTTAFQVDAVVSSGTLTIDDYPVAAGEQTVTYTPGSDANIISTLELNSVQVSEVTFAALDADEAAIQTGPVITGGLAPGDTLTAVLPHTHFTTATLNDRIKWLLGGMDTGVGGLTYDRPGSTQPIVFRYEVLDGGGNVILTDDTAVPDTVITPVAPDLEDNAINMLLSTLQEIPIDLEEDEDEDLILVSVLKVSGDATLGDVDTDAGTFEVTTSATPGVSVFRPTIANATGGTATKDITIAASSGVALSAGLTEAETLTYDANCFVQDFSGKDALQNSPSNSTAGEAFGIWAGSAGNYDITLQTRTDVDGDGSAVWTLEINDVVHTAWTADGSANGFDPRTASGVALAVDDKIGITMNGYDAVGGPIWAAFSEMTIVENFLDNPEDPSHGSWTFSGSTSYTADVADHEGSDKAWTFTSVTDGDAVTGAFSGVTDTASYTLSTTINASGIADNRHFRVVLFGDSVWFDTNEGASAPIVSRNDSSLTVSITSLGGDWYTLDVTNNANATSGVIKYLIAVGATGVEGSGDIDFSNMTLTAN